MIAVDVSKKQKTFYQLLKPTVLGYVTHYRDDFLVHDRAFFRREPNAYFLMAIRETGTDITNLRGFDELNDEEKERSKATAITWMTTYNKRFFIGKVKNGHRVVREIDKSEAIEILEAL